MDVSSVISVSSSSCRVRFRTASPQSLPSIFSLSSESTGDGANNNSRDNRKCNLSVDLPDVPNKVENWLESTQGNDVDNSSTCIRYDFDKSVQAPDCPQSCFTNSTTLFSYMVEAKKEACIKSNLIPKIPAEDKPRANGVSAHKQDEITIDNPLSPESQKKELCNYLKLMNPLLRTKEKHLSTYRRSRRVQSYNKQVITGEHIIPGSEYVETPVNLNSQKSVAKRENGHVLLPLPPEHVYKDEIDFEESVKEIVKYAKGTIKSKTNGALNIFKKRKNFNFNLRGTLRNIYRRKSNSLRSKGYLRSVSLDSLILRHSSFRNRLKRRLAKSFKRKPVKNKGTQDCMEKETEVHENEEAKQEVSKILLVEADKDHCSDEIAETHVNSDNVDNSHCEIVSFKSNSDEDDIDLKNFVDDMLHLGNMSEEHKKSVIESRILTCSAITNLISKRQLPQTDNVQKAFKIFSDISNEQKNSEEQNEERREETEEEKDEGVEEENVETSQGQNAEKTVQRIMAEHDYANYSGPTEDEDDEEESSCSLSSVSNEFREKVQVNKFVDMKSSHRTLAVSLRKKRYRSNGMRHWTSSCGSDPNQPRHSISISKMNGKILKGFYQDYNLVLVQETSVSFWTQSALGETLGAQNMWIPKGQAQRIPLNDTYCQKNAVEMMISTDTSVAYVELWTKQHKSDVREVPVADVFITVYFWRFRQSGLDKKALQLENIKGQTEDVQYCVWKSYPKVVVSWYSSQGREKRTNIHSHHLAADFQTVANISELQPVEHYVASLINVEDSDNLVMGCGDNRLTLWNIEYGHIVSTINMINIQNCLSTTWAKCDRGFLFTIQECPNQELRLIALNGMNHSWKRLQNYVPVQGYHKLKGALIENGLLLAYYQQGILCWNALTGELILEELHSDCEFIPSGKHVIILSNDNVLVKYSLSHLIAAGDL